MTDTICVKPNTVYRHFKGRYYLVIGVFKDTSGVADVVGYRPLYKDATTDSFAGYYRRVDEFLDLIDRPEYGVTNRFKLIENIVHLNRSYKDDCGIQIKQFTDSSHPVAKIILSRTPFALPEIFCDLRKGLLSSFSSVDACEPCVYLSSVEEVGRWHGGLDRILTSRERLLIRAVKQAIPSLDSSVNLATSRHLGIYGRRRRISPLRRDEIGTVSASDVVLGSGQLLLTHSIRSD